MGRMTPSIQNPASSFPYSPLSSLVYKRVKQSRLCTIYMRVNSKNLILSISGINIYNFGLYVLKRVKKPLIYTVYMNEGLHCAKEG